VGKKQSYTAVAAESMRIKKNEERVGRRTKRYAKE
jgi:hypothetical protein